MNLIIISIIIGIIILLILATIDSIIELNNMAQHNDKFAFAIKWFIYILAINILILILIIYYNYYMESNGLVGAVGVKGYTGSSGRPAPSCVISQCVKNNTLMATQEE